MEQETQRLRLAASLRILRIQHQYTQQAIADLIGLERSSYARYETGNNVPSIFMLDRIASVYGITVDAILHNPLAEMLCQPTQVQSHNSAS